MKIRRISVAGHHMITNNDSTPGFSGMDNPLVSIALLFNVKVTSWVNVIGHERQQKGKIRFIFLTVHHIITTNHITPTFSGIENPLVPSLFRFKAKFTHWINDIGHGSNQNVNILCHSLFLFSRFKAKVTHWVEVKQQ